MSRRNGWIYAVALYYPAESIWEKVEDNVLPSVTRESSSVAKNPEFEGKLKKLLDVPVATTENLLLKHRMFKQLKKIINR